MYGNQSRRTKSLNSNQLSFVKKNRNCVGSYSRGEAGKYILNRPILNLRCFYPINSISLRYAKTLTITIANYFFFLNINQSLNTKQSLKTYQGSLS